MKTLRYLLVLAVAAMLMASCGYPDHLKTLPKETVAVVSFDLAGMAAKGDLDKLQEADFYKKMQEKMRKKMMDDPAEKEAMMEKMHTKMKENPEMSKRMMSVMMETAKEDTTMMSDMCKSMMKNPEMMEMMKKMKEKESNQ